MFGDGIALIESALSQFDKVKEKLQKGIEAVKTKINENEGRISEINVENGRLDAMRVKAEKAYQGITKLLEGK